MLVASMKSKEVRRAIMYKEEYAASKTGVNIFTICVHEITDLGTIEGNLVISIMSALFGGLVECTPIWLAITMDSDARHTDMTVSNLESTQIVRSNLSNKLRGHCRSVGKVDILGTIRV